MISLTTMPGRYAICRLPAGARPPVPAAESSFVSITRTQDEVSIVCDEQSAPAGARTEPGWNLLKVNGPLDFSAVGVVASLTAPIAAAGISLFVVSTFDTDYLLVKSEYLKAASDALRRAGHAIDAGGATS